MSPKLSWPKNMSFLLFKKKSKVQQQQNEDSDSNKSELNRALSERNRNSGEGKELNSKRIFEKFRPPLVEGRAQIQTDILEYIPGPKLELESQRKTLEEKSVNLSHDLEDKLSVKSVEKSVDLSHELEDKLSVKSAEKSVDNISQEEKDSLTSESVQSDLIMGSPKAEQVTTSDVDLVHDKKQKQEQEQKVDLDADYQKGEPSKVESSSEQKSSSSTPPKNDAAKSGEGSGKSPSSENSRDFEEPEGSPDMTPSSDTPAYSRWADHINNLLEDHIGSGLFLEYLKQQNLEHYINFWAFCNGFKDVRPEKIKKIGQIAFRKYIAPKSDHGPLIDCLDEDVRSSIKSKITSDSIDVNVFDGAQQLVVEHMARTSFIKFFESDIYISYVQSVQNDLSEVNSSRYSGTQSSSSSVSGRAGIVPSKVPSSIPLSSSTTSTTTTSEPPNNQVTADLKTFGSAISETSDSTTSTLTSKPKSLVTDIPLENTSQHQQFPLVNTNMSLDAIEEDSVLSFGDNNNHGSGNNNKKRGGRNTNFGNNNSSGFSSSSLQSQSHVQRFPPNSKLYRGTPQFPGSEIHPQSSGSTSSLMSSSMFGGNQSSHGNTGRLGSLSHSTSNVAAPYHAMSSTYNPVSRNDSEVQSQSSGALGDLTDDGTYSSFTDFSSSQYSSSNNKQQQQQQQLQQRSGSTHDVSKKSSSSLRTSQHLNTKYNKIQQVRRNKPETEILKKPTRAGEQPPAPMNETEFAQILFQKLTKVKQEREQKEKMERSLAQKLSRCDEFDNKDLKATDFESDQSILDDHCSRVFDEKTPVRTPPTERRGRHQTRQPNVSMNMSTQSGLMSASFGNQTWGGHRSRGQQQYKPQPHYGHQFNSSSSMNTSYPTSSQVSGFTGFNQPPQDLAYYPQESSSTLNQKHRAALNAANVNMNAVGGATSGGGSASAAGASASKSFSDFADFQGSRQQQQSRLQQPQPFQQTDDRVTNWVQHVNSNNDSWSGSGQNNNNNNNNSLTHHNTLRSTSMTRTAMRTSPRSSGRSKRSKSQERQFPGLSNNPFYQHQSQPMHMQPQQQPHPPQPIGVNQDRTVVYTFTQAKYRNMPYLVRCSDPNITLRKVKEMCPKKGEFRYFFKTLIDGMEVLEEKYDDYELVPLLRGRIIVECCDLED